MFYEKDLCHYHPMVYFEQQGDERSALRTEAARPLLRTLVHVERHLVPLLASRKKARPGAVKAGMDIEPYSSAILQPLTAACVFRDCSLRRHTSLPERQACRTLMRQAAIKWRRGWVMGDL